MKYLQFAYVGEHQLPAVPGLLFEWARESLYPTDKPQLFGTCPDTSSVDVPGVIALYGLSDYAQMRADEMNARGTSLSAKRSAIKVERERRKGLGVKYGADWYHSDAGSRTQQLGLMMMGAGVPAGLQWKTLTRTGTVFVTMTQAIASGIFNATAASDQAIFSSAESHQTALTASADPALYDVRAAWPASFEDTP